MATKWISPTWRMPEEQNQSKFENYSLDFDSAGPDHIFLVNSAQVGTDFSTIGNANSYSFSFWVNTTNSTSLGSPAWYSDVCILELRTETGSGTKVPFNIGMNGGKLFFGRTPNHTTSDQFFESTALINTGNWVHCAITIEVNTLKIYINNSLDSTHTFTVATGDCSVGSTTSNFIIASRTTNSGAPSAPFDGRIDHMSIFNYTLSTNQRNYLYNSGTPVNPMAISGNAPIAYYPLGGSSTGSASTLTTPNESVPSATVFDFGGSNNEKITTGDSSLLNGASAASFSLWVKGKTGLASYDGMLCFRSGSDYILIIARGTITATEFPVWIQQSGGGVTTNTSNAIVPLNEWNHIVIVGAVGGKWNIYVNGELSSTQVQDTNNIAAISQASAFLIGHDFTTRDFVGEMSNVQIWNTELSTAEITTLYNYGSPLSGTQPQAANLKAWYPMDVGNANWEADTASTWQIPDALSLYPQSFNFNDTTDAINVSGISLGTVHTINFWVNFKPPYGTRAAYILSSGSENGWVVYANNGGTLYYKAGSSQYYSGTMTAPTAAGVGEWHNITITRNGAEINFYQNGNTTPFATTSTFAGASTPLGDIDFISADRSYGSSIRYSNFTFYDTEFSPSQVSQIYNNGVPLTSAIATSNLKAWYKLDNTATFSTNWSIPDASGNGNTGTSSGMTEQNLVNNNVSTLNGTSSGMTTANLVNSDLTRSIPYSSYSMSFDGVSNEYINCGHSALTAISGGSNTLSTSMTISMWFKLGDSSTSRGLINFGSLSNTYGGFTIRHQSNALNFLKESTHLITGGYAFTDTSSWHHMAFVYDPTSSSNCYLYIDGVNTGVSFVNVGNLSFQNSNLTNRNLIIGAYYGDSDTFTGNISNCSIYNKLLTNDQVLTIYNGGVPNDISSLSPVGWWSLAGDSYYNGTDFICPDLSSNSNNGTSSGMGGTELVGNGPGSTANGIATSMNIPENLQGNAPNSTKNAFSVNMTETDRVSGTGNVPPTIS